jgi:hypothetical protein
MHFILSAVQILLPNPLLVLQDRQNKLRPFCIDHFPLSLYHFFYDAKYNEYEGSHQEVV